ncbi:MAG: hypothetical protein GX801_00930 [Fibrobacter sp.]|nr:hypothetical protein [Fibrobacter sp.]
MWGSVLNSIVLASFLQCPYISEMHADPTTMEDSQGEYFEVVLPKHLSDTLHISVHNNQQSYFIEASAPQRLVFCHQDTLKLLPEQPVPCLVWDGNLPNSTEIFTQISWASCRDSVVLPRSKAGKSWVRNSPNNPWNVGDATPGFPDPQWDKNLENRIPKVQISARYPWKLKFEVHPGDSLYWEVFSLDQKTLGKGILTQDSAFYLPSAWPIHLQLQLRLVGDDFPLDNLLDTIIFPKDNPPLSLTEVVICPPEEENEWWELENKTLYHIAAHRISPCTGPSAISPKLIPPKSLAIMGNDTNALKEEFGESSLINLLSSSKNIRLRNTIDTLNLCLDHTQIQQIHWKIASGKCQTAYDVKGDTLIAKTEHSPGYKIQASSFYKSLRISSQRAHKGKSIEIRADPELLPWTYKLYNNKATLLQHGHSDNSNFLIKIEEAPKSPLYLVIQGADAKKHSLVLHGIYLP